MVSQSKLETAYDDAAELCRENRAAVGEALATVFADDALRAASTGTQDHFTVALDEARYAEPLESALRRRGFRAFRHGYYVRVVFAGPDPVFQAVAGGAGVYACFDGGLTNWRVETVLRQAAAAERRKADPGRLRRWLRCWLCR